MSMGRFNWPFAVLIPVSGFIIVCAIIGAASFISRQFH